MPAANGFFTVSVRSPDELVLDGELDMGSAPKLEAAIAEIESIAPLVMDLSNLTFIDSTGVNCLLVASKRTGQPIVLRRPKPSVARVLALAGEFKGWAPWVIEDGTGT